jgi:hypothetical protein
LTLTLGQSLGSAYVPQAAISPQRHMSDPEFDQGLRAAVGRRQIGLDGDRVGQTPLTRQHRWPSDDSRGGLNGVDLADLMGSAASLARGRGRPRNESPPGFAERATSGDDCGPRDAGEQLSK